MEIQELVSREIYLNQTMLISKLCGDEDMFPMDEVENFYFTACPECGSEVIGNDQNDNEFTCENCDTIYTADEYANLDDEPREVFEWYAISDWLARKLKDNHEVVIQNEYGTWWGRQCTGQAIYMDHVIEKIYASL